MRMIGQRTEYPELEMLPPVSPAYIPDRQLSRSLSLGFDREDSVNEDSLAHRVSGTMDDVSSARKWSRHYEDCVRDPSRNRLSPSNSDGSTRKEHRFLSMSEIGPMDIFVGNDQIGAQKESHEPQAASD